ncbi:DEAD/DEAH box helicase [Frigoribacterium sp. VKM Ac-2530]|uniref:Lhr family ATP-dependent helicase n=1 Tax=Frigoribacterium sp. VKM Ac-2530 TaxID=2783822 RepID=UPI00188BDFA9|nr:DEAD/DEAH box helicase [Frigoribacterium sp. VKM Ac-2530]MBF4580568.1 DEAD/DEAH box helicase [Frigoribacterium sp. VKM Ac-2530]
MTDILERFSPATREWFRGAFAAPTLAQLGAWQAISEGDDALVIAPTGSGKTLASFLWSIDTLASGPPPEVREHRTRVLYISPLKALGVDVERNLRSPLVGITQTARRLGIDAPELTVGVRSGDTSSGDRRLLQRTPPDILITTPESLYLMLTSAARENLKGVHTVIVDEVHAVAATKRGAHLALSLERLDALLEKPAQRIGLSATVRPPTEVARFLSGRKPVTIVNPRSEKTFDLRVVVPVDDMTELGTAAPLEGSAAGSAPQGSIWPHVEEGIVDLILDHRSTIVFSNSRRLAERLTARLNDIYLERTGADVETRAAALQAADEARGELVPAGAVPEGAAGASGSSDASDSSTVVDPFAPSAPASPPRNPMVGGGAPAQLIGGSGQTQGSEPLLARAHHGSVSKDQRAIIEDDLKSGRLRCVVATSSLELGIDMGAVDLVVQVESPPSVASGLQRVGRAGHQVGEISRGVVFPKHRADLIHSAVAAERMVAGLIEELRVPTNPLDVLAQQTVAAVALDEIDADEWFETVRRSAPFATLPRSAYDATLDLLSGKYPSDEFAELRPRIVWDRVHGTLTGRPGAQRLAVTSGGTIPDRGLFGVFMVGEKAARVGELDEEMVYESRVGDVFALGATSWRIEDITHDRVLVSPAYGQPGRVPFWKGDGIGRPAELGRAIGGYIRELASSSTDDATQRVTQGGLDERAARNLLAFVTEQREATGHVPSDTTLVVERFRDELGDWRLVLHSPYGMQVHAPWALAISARIRDQLGVDGGAMAADDGIVVRIPDTDAEPPGSELFRFEGDDLDAIVTEEVGGSALFSSRFRECAARALLLPRYNPGRRSPLWQQRQRASQLLDVARKYPQFPIVLEAVREVLQDVYDLPALMSLTRELETRAVRVVEVETEVPSPLARSLLFGYVAAFMYEGDSPLAERRAAALSLDSTLLQELLGRAELRELLDADVIDQHELELQRLAPDRRARDIEGVVDLLRLLGPLTTSEIVDRSWLATTAGSAATITVNGEAEAESDAGDDTDAPAGDAVAGDAVAGDTVAAESAEAAEGRTKLEAALTDLVRSNRVLRFTHGGTERWAGIEDASRLRDALGVALPIGVPTAFVEPVDDPLGDLVGRFARTHAPFTPQMVADRLGLGTAVVLDTLRKLGVQRRVVEGEFRPQQQGSEWCDSEVLKRLRSRSLAALRHEVEPVAPDTLGRFLPAWQHVATGTKGSGLRGLDGVVQVVDQLSGVALPASAWETLILPSRVTDYGPGMLDELTATGEVIWSGSGSLAGNDGWVSLHLADGAQVTLPEPLGTDTDELQREVLGALAGGGAYFFRQLSDAVGSTDDAALVTAIWDLVWAGQITNDTFAPLRTQVSGKASRPRTPTRSRSSYRSRGRVTMPRQAGPPTVGGRWSLLPLAEPDATVRAAAQAEILLERHGVVTRGAVMNEGVRGGFSTVYKVLSGFEETGRARRGYFVEGLGAAQFATGPTVDRLRSFVRDETDRRDDDALASAGRGREIPVVTLAATDPANPYGAALPWPGQPAAAEGAAGDGAVAAAAGLTRPDGAGGVADRPTTGNGTGTGTGAAVAAAAGTSKKTGHRPGRKAGSLVVLVDGRLTVYVERGGKTLLTFGEPDDRELALAAGSLASVVRTRLGKLAVERVDGEFVLGTRLGDALRDAGFAPTPSGIRLRS